MLLNKATRNACPVCGYDGMAEPAYDEKGCASFEICPCCGTEFGYDDSLTKHKELRRKWVAGGSKWWSKSQRPPPGWNPEGQLRNVPDDA
jgi:hypothetical protein